MTKFKPLPSQEYLQECFNYDPETGLLYWKNRPQRHFKDSRAWKTWNSQFPDKVALNVINPRGYCTGTLNNTSVRTHRVVWKLLRGTEPELILHEGGKTTDNRIEKLSNGDDSINAKDKKLYSTNSSGIVGIHWCNTRNKWLAQINEDGKRKNLGYFLDFFEACCKRKSAEAKLDYHPSHGKR